MSTQSCIYEGHVRHRRFAPVKHEFKYRLFLMYVDLDVLSDLFHRRWLWSVDRPNLAWFHRGDHLGRRDMPLAEAVRGLVHERTGKRPTGPICLLTNFRSFGFAMNPISLYYCWSETEAVEFVVAEVNNTPWNEQTCYVLELRRSPAVKKTLVCEVPKRLLWPNRTFAATGLATTWRRSSGFSFAVKRSADGSIEGGHASPVWAIGVSTAGDPTVDAEAGAISPRITTWATIFSPSGSMKRWLIHAAFSPARKPR